MNGQEFTKGIEGVFGKYSNQLVKAAVIKFVSNNWPDDELPTLLNYTIANHSTQYKTQPDVNFFNQVWEKNHDPVNVAELAWLELEKLKSDRSILCTDIVTQETIISMGGIDEFLEYRSKEHNWSKKTFVETYARLFKLPDIYNREFKIIKNKAELHYPKFPKESFYRDVKVIGDESKGKLLIDNEKDKLEIEHNDGVKLLKNIIKDMGSG